MEEIKINFDAFDLLNKNQTLTVDLMKRKLKDHEALLLELASAWQGEGGSAYLAAIENALKQFYISIEALDKLRNSTAFTKFLFMEKDSNLSQNFLKNEVKK